MTRAARLGSRHHGCAESHQKIAKMQRGKMWQANRLSDQPLWLSTAGMGGVAARAIGHAAEILRSSAIHFCAVTKPRPTAILNGRATLLFEEEAVR
jgi:hypothetical protein